jgi:hypothetical protein
MPSRPTPGDHRAVPPTVGIRRGPVTGRTQLNAVGDKSPYSLIPSTRDGCIDPIRMILLRGVTSWRLILDSAIGLAAGVEALRSIAFVS